MSELAPYAADPARSRGRRYAEPEPAYRSAFQRDRDRIVHCAAFRRLEYKTQVFVNHEGDLFRTRLTHSIEVAQIGRSVARAMGFNEDLTEAIALAHDLGHTPFGHAGERVFDELLPEGFRHNEQSVRVVTLLEPMNLSWEVRDGVLHHTGCGTAATLEGQIVKIADRVAYLNHDIDDALRAGILRESDLPGFVYETFGVTKGQRIAAMVMDLVRETARDYASVRMSEAFHERFLELRAFMFKRVYTGSKAKVEEGKAQRIIAQLFEHYCTHPDELAAELGRPVDDRRQATVDYIAGMTDRFAIQQYENLFVPRPWRLGDELRRDV